jgi:hypothetical protein
MPRRPEVLVIFAVLNIIVGALLLFCGVCSGSEGTLTVNGKDVTEQMKEHMNTEIPGYTAIRMTGVVTAIALGLGFLASGIGLLNLMQWGRVVGLVCAAVAILQQIATSLFQVLAVAPARARFLDKFGPISLGFVATIWGWVVLAGALVVVTCSVIVLVGLLSRSVSQAFSRPRRDFEDDEDDDDWEDRRRRPARRRPPREEEVDEEPRERSEGITRRRPPPREEDDLPPRRRPPRPRDEEDEDDEDYGDPRPRPRRPR